MNEERRAEILACFGAQPDEIPDLLRYNANDFRHDLAGYPVRLPLDAEQHLEAWGVYAAKAAVQGVFRVLTDVLVQLHFPIRQGVSQTDEYRAATLRGRPISELSSATGLPLSQPERLELMIYRSLAGSIPVLIVRNRHDFCLLVQALTTRNEPSAVPDSMGACIVAGYNNWDRIRRLRKAWEENPKANSEFEWQDEFRRRLIPQKEKYQDRFIILSDSPYSGVPGSLVGVGDEEWAALSLTIRLEHECAHYLTRRLLARMKNNVLDELIADYCGIVAAAADFRADWFLRFMGLEQSSAYRAGGRLENYRGDPRLSDGAFVVLQRLVISAAENLQSFHRERISRPAPLEQTARLALSLARLTMEELAGPEAQERLGEVWDESQRQVLFK